MPHIFLGLHYSTSELKKYLALFHAFPNSAHSSKKSVGEMISVLP